MTIWVILGLLVWLLLILVFVADDKFLPSFWVLVVPGAIASYFAWGGIVAWFSGLSTMTMIMAPFFYIVAGFAVAVIKWAFRSSKAAGYVAEIIASNNWSPSDINHVLRVRYEGLRMQTDNGVHTLTRSDSFNSVVGAWVIWWPFVLLASLFTDFIQNIVRILTGWMGGTFQAITDYFFKQANKGN